LGIGPENLFSLRNKVSRLVLRPIEDGIVPFRLFLEIINSSRSVKALIVAGILLVSLLL